MTAGPEDTQQSPGPANRQATGPDMAPTMGPAIRLDKWLWHARFYKSRSIAAQAIKGGKIRINKRKPKRASVGARVGDVLTIVRGTQVMVVELLGLGARRGPAPEAQLLYNVLDKTEKLQQNGIGI